MTFRISKTFGHDLGISVAFRQWRAASHCAKLHGYALAFRVEFEAADLDDHGWVVDFGALKSLRAQIEEMFDHKTIVAADDPDLSWFEQAQDQGILDLVVMSGVGCERFAEAAYVAADRWLKSEGLEERCRVLSVEVSEHGANRAAYIG